MLGHPVLVPGHDRRDAQREALLAQQGVAAVARSERPDLACLGEVHDVLVVGVAGPRHVLGAIEQRHAHRVHARHELASATERVERRLAHASHDPHVHRHVGRVGELHAHVALVRAQRPHRERHDIHRAPLHRAFEQIAQHLPHLSRVAPVVRRPRRLLGGRADERAVLHARHIGRIRQRQIGVRALRLRQRRERARRHHLRA